MAQAIYPMLIVVLVALNKSQLAKGIPGQSIQFNAHSGAPNTLPTSTARGTRYSTVRFATPTQLESASSCPVIATLSLGTQVDSEEVATWSEAGCQWPLAESCQAKKGSLAIGESKTWRHSDRILEEPKQ